MTTVTTLRPRSPFGLSRGFTLIELLVVIAIIGVLSTLVLLQLGTARSRSRDAKRIADVSQLRSAVELFYDDNGSYPADITTAYIGDYMTNVPSDPLISTLLYGYTSNAAAGAEPNPDRTKYQVWAELERKSVGALNGDVDINSAAAPWVAMNARGAIDGSLETCADASVTVVDCVYDLGQP